MFRLTENFRPAVSWLAFAAVWLCASSYGVAQSVPVLVSGNGEVGGLGAFNGGAMLSSESALVPGSSGQRITSPPSNGSITIQAGWSLQHRLLVLAEWGYLAGGKSVFNEVYVVNQPAPVTQSASVIARGSATRISSGLQYLMPLRRAPRIVPYAGLGGGALRSSGDLSVSAVGGPPGGSFSGPYTSYHGLVSGVAGTRYYFNERVGIKIEAEVNHVAARGVYASIGLGIFARFR